MPTSPNKDKHVVSVIVPTLGRKTINLCKDALKKQTRPPDEIIVILDSEKRGTSWARNEGIRKSSGDLLAFIDDDCIPPEDWIEKLVFTINKYDCSGVGGTYIETDPLLDYSRKQRKLPENEQFDKRGIVGLGGNVMYKRSWLDTLARYDGYVFNEKYKSYASEDWELALRLRLYGATFVYIPLKVTHLRVMSPFSYCVSQFKRGIGIAKLYYFQRSVKSKITIHKSNIWDQENSKKRTKWLKAFLNKIIGPFDIFAFQHKRNFLLYWVGEKCQALGFAWAIIINTIKNASIYKKESNQIREK